MSVVSMVVGAVGPSGATFVAKVDGGGPVRVAIADNPSMLDAVFTSSQAVDAQGVARVGITGLDPATRYFWQVEDNSVLDATNTGQFLTHPPLGVAASFTIAASSCAGNQPEVPGVTGSELSTQHVSNHPVFDTIRQRALAEDWLGFVHLGDLHYYDPGSGAIVPDASVGTYRTAYDDVFAQPRQHQLYRELNWVYAWDDHDAGPNNWDSTFAFKANAAQVYRERVPHYPLADSDSIYQSFQIGRVLFVVTDTRYNRSPNTDPDDASKTMLGAAQKAWLQNLLTTTAAEALVILTQDPWIPTGTDTWGQFRTEQAELVEMFGDTGWLSRMVMVHTDRHVLALTGGATNAWGGFPVMCAASLDASNPSSTNPDWFDIIPETPGRDQYGTVTVTDLGSALTITLTAWQGEHALGSHTLGISLAPPTVAAGDALLRSLPGTHRVVLEARVLSEFQTGDDPSGVAIDVAGGDVTYDATARVLADLNLVTPGLDERRRSRFPRRAADLLAPYGNEVFVRYGLDLGSHIEWVPLGYFRLDGAGQSPASDSPISLAGQDRMSGIIDGRLVQPRFFSAGRTVASVITELVTDVYPDAVILFDDDSAQEPTGRDLIIEADRHEALLDLARSLGKVVYWDGHGFLRVEDAPDPENIVWDIKAGRDGVLVDSGREVSREGMANGVVATGEGVTGDAVRAVVVDKGVNSPTRWGGRFGKVPREYASPLLTTADQARKAAASLLRRYIGMPYQVSFGAFTNPGLRPREVVRITQKDGNRERHLVETCTVPLSTGAVMTGTTREQTLVTVGEL